MNDPATALDDGDVTIPGTSEFAALAFDMIRQPFENISLANVPRPRLGVSIPNHVNARRTDEAAEIHVLESLEGNLDGIHGGTERTKGRESAQARSGNPKLASRRNDSKTARISW